MPKVRDQWRTVVKRVMNIQVPHKVECSSKKWRFSVHEKLLIALYEVELDGCKHKFNACIL